MSSHPWWVVCVAVVVAVISTWVYYHPTPVVELESSANLTSTNLVNTLRMIPGIDQTGFAAFQALNHTASVLRSVDLNSPAAVTDDEITWIRGFLERLIQNIESSLQTAADPVKPVLDQDGVMRISAFFLSMVLARTPPARDSIGSSAIPKPCFLCPPEGAAIARKQRGYLVTQDPFHHPESKVVAVMIAGLARSFFGIHAFWRIFIENIRQSGREPVLFVVTGRQTYNTFLDRFERPGGSAANKHEVQEESFQELFHTLGVEGRVRLVNGSFEFQAYVDQVDDPLLKAVLESPMALTESGSNAGAMKRTVAFDMILQWEREHSMAIEHVISMRPDVILNAQFVTNASALSDMFKASHATSVIFNDFFGFLPRAHIGAYVAYPAMHRSQVQAVAAGNPLFQMLFDVLVGHDPACPGCGSLSQPSTMLSYLEVPFRGLSIESQWLSSLGRVSLMTPEPLLDRVPGCDTDLVEFVFFIREAMIHGKYFPCVDHSQALQTLVQTRGPMYINGVFNPLWKCGVLPGIFDNPPIPLCPPRLGQELGDWRANWSIGES